MRIQNFINTYDWWLHTAWDRASKESKSQTHVRRMLNRRHEVEAVRQLILNTVVSISLFINLNECWLASRVPFSFRITLIQKLVLHAFSSPLTPRVRWQTWDEKMKKTLLGSNWESSNESFSFKVSFCEQAWQLGHTCNSFLQSPGYILRTRKESATSELNGVEAFISSQSCESCGTMLMEFH